MSMQLEVTVYGPELARLLMNDAEEMAYFLKTMADDSDVDELGNDIAWHDCGRDDVAAWLRALADRIAGGGK